ncbi:hypothetical protein ACFQ14_14645 [Pseudahrensia aquimaris]|uniref:Beta-lactamase n=1 Tax=Pseudahrensia aquimaris TaxID=744461 RepID=A0ABW3FGL7_9HYPH
MKTAIDADDRFNAAFRSCPAEQFGENSSFFYRWAIFTAPSWATCLDNPMACLNACKSGSERACFRAARWVERFFKETHNVEARKIYAFGCTVGSRGSCLNRGGGLRNSYLEEDTFQNDDEDQRAACEYSLFKHACSKDGKAASTGWGCAMLGQATELGQGTEFDLVEAERLYRKGMAASCVRQQDETSEDRTLKPACAFAERRLKFIRGQ